MCRIRSHPMRTARGAAIGQGAGASQREELARLELVEAYDPEVGRRRDVDDEAAPERL